MTSNALQNHLWYCKPLPKHIKFKTFEKHTNFPLVKPSECVRKPPEKRVIARDNQHRARFCSFSPDFHQILISPHLVIFPLSLVLFFIFFSSLTCFDQFVRPKICNDKVPSHNSRDLFQTVEITFQLKDMIMRR